MSERAFTLEQMSSLSGLDSGLVSELAKDGVLDAFEDPCGNAWFGESALRRILVYRRVRSVIGANHEGAEFAVLLLRDIEQLREQLARSQPQHHVIGFRAEPQEDE
jgi:hypothetical protein